MPKQKTHSGTKDRVRTTKTGKLVVGHTSTNHNMRKKSAARKRRINTLTVITGKHLKQVKLQLGA